MRSRPVHSFDDLEYALDCGKLLVKTPDGTFAPAIRIKRTWRGCTSKDTMRLEMLVNGVPFGVTSERRSFDDFRIAA